MFTQAEMQDYNNNGYAVARAVFTPQEVEQWKAHFMHLRGKGTYPGDFDGVDITSTDPLQRFPRMIHMHRWDESTLSFLLDTRLKEALTELLGIEPLAVQTMLYFKPAGARGQALHQDQTYLRVQPGTCMAAWLALDPCDEENGCMQVVPGSHTWPVLCTQKADTAASFTDVTVPLPDGVHPVPVRMAAGDVLFFNGSLVHGSFPNTSTDRFRRSLIGHYIVGDAEKVGGFYHPVLKMDGTNALLDTNDGGGPCGVWAERDGKAMIEMAFPAETAAVGHE